MDYYSFYMEKWLPIIGYDWYEVSDLGRVGLYLENYDIEKIGN